MKRLSSQHVALKPFAGSTRRTRRGRQSPKRTKLGIETLEPRRLLAASVVQEIESNNFRSTANHLGVIGEQVIEGTSGFLLGDPDNTRYIDIDSFSFDVETAGEVSFKLEKKPVWQQYDLSVLLYDNLTGQTTFPITTTARTSAIDSASFGDLSAGRYYVQLLTTGVSTGVDDEVANYEYRFQVFAGEPEEGTDIGGGNTGGGNTGGGGSTGSGPSNDAWEPNDALGQSISVGGGAEIPREVTFVDAVIANNDIDHFTFFPTGPGVISIDVDAWDGDRSTLNSAIEVFRQSTGQQLAANDDAVDPQTGSNLGDAYVEFTDLSSEPIVVRVAGVDGSTGAYRLKFKHSPRIPFGRYEFNDTIETASVQALVPNVPLRLVETQIRPADDVDHFRFDLNRAGWLTLDIDARERGLSGLDARITLMTLAGEVIELNDAGVDPDSGYRGLDPVVSRLLTQGSYIARIDGQSSEVDNFYTLTALFEPTGGTVDVIGDSHDSARPVPKLEPVFVNRNSSTIDHPNDVDMFRLDFTDLVHPTLLRIDIDAEAFGSTLDSYVRVFDADGRQVASNDDAADPATSRLSGDSHLQTVLLTPGFYYVGVSSFGNDRYNPSAGTTGSGGTTTGDYLLKLDTRVSKPAAGNRKQTVWLDFDGGLVRDYQKFEFNVPPFRASDLGRPTHERQAIIDRVYQRVLEDFILGGSFENPDIPLNLLIDFTLDRPPADVPYSTIRIGGRYPHPDFNGALGLVEDVDIGNKNIEDIGAAFSQAFSQFDNVFGRDIDTVSLALANTVSHEIGHLLGLSHRVEPGLLMQTGALDLDRRDDERFGIGRLYRGPRSSPGDFEDSVALLRQNLRIPPEFVGPEPGDPSFTGIGQISTIIYQLVNSNQSMEFTMEAANGDVLVVDIDSASLGGLVDLSMELVDDRGTVVARSSAGVDPLSDAAGVDPYLRYQVFRPGTFSVRIFPNQLSLATLSGDDDPQSVVVNVHHSDAVIEQRLRRPRIEIGRTTKSVGLSQNAFRQIVDADGRQIDIRLQGGGTVKVITDSGNPNVGSIEQIILDGVTDQTTLAVSADRPGARVGKISVNDSGGATIIVGSEAVAIDLDELIAVGKINTVELNGRLGRRLSVGGELDRLQIDHIDAHAEILVSESLEQLHLGATTGGTIRVAGELNRVAVAGDFASLLHASSIGEVTIRGSVIAAEHGDEIEHEHEHNHDGELIGRPVGSLVADGVIGSVEISGAFSGSIRAGESISGLEVGGISAGTIIGGRLNRLRLDQGTTLIQSAGESELSIVLHQQGRIEEGFLSNQLDQVEGLRLIGPLGQVVRRADASGLSFHGVSAGTYQLRWTTVNSATVSWVLHLPDESEGFQLDPEEVSIVVPELTATSISLEPSTQYRAILFASGSRRSADFAWNSGANPDGFAPRLIDVSDGIISSLASDAFQSDPTKSSSKALSSSAYAVLVPPHSQVAVLTWSSADQADRILPTTQALLPTDVNLDQKVTALDALTIINHLTASEPPIANSNQMLDVNADGSITALDALTVINRLSQSVAFSSEGESIVDIVIAAPQVPIAEIEIVDRAPFSTAAHRNFSIEPDDPRSGVNLDDRQWDANLNHNDHYFVTEETVQPASYGEKTSNGAFTQVIYHERLGRVNRRKPMTSADSESIQPLFRSELREISTILLGKPLSPRR